MHTSSGKWLISLSDIKPGSSAVLEGNHLAFLSIQFAALCIIPFSVFSSLIIICRILIRSKRGVAKLDMAARFPLYIAVIEVCWGISNFPGHLYLFLEQKVPENRTFTLVLSMFTAVSFGATQFFRIAITITTYMAVVQRKRLQLGFWEWKLHLTGLALIFVVMPPFHFLESFGFTGIGFSYDASTWRGGFLFMFAAVLCSVNAIVTVAGHYAIKLKVLEQKEKLAKLAYVNTEGSTPVALNLSMNAAHRFSMGGYHSIVIECLSTHIVVTGCLYCPLALLIWISILLQASMGVMEPVTCLLLTIVGNSSGWANALGYFLNESHKRRRRRGRDTHVYFNPVRE